MKTVVFICLLSFSACLSDQSLPQDVKPMGQDLPKKGSLDAKAPAIVEQVATQSLNEAAISSALEQKASASQAQLTSTAPNLTSDKNITIETKNNVTTLMPTDPKQNTTKADNKTDNKLPETKESDAKSTEGKDVKPTMETPKNETKAAETASKLDKNSTITDDKKETTTTKNMIMKPTEAPTLQTRGFDGPSFIGGIILTLGLIAISFMGYKYYKNQTERNYYGTL